MKLGYVALCLSLVAGSVASVGCSGGTEQQAPQTSASALGKAPIGANSHGMVKLVGEALGEVTLRPEQRTELEKLANEAEARHASLAAGRKDLMLAVADQVEKGSIDRAALQPKVDRITADAAKAQPEDRAALVRVHDILDAEQRNAFADAMEQKFKGKHGGPGDHADGEHGPGKHGGLGKLKQLADDLKLTEEQRTQIKDALKGLHGEHGDHVRPGGPDGAQRWEHHARAEGDKAGDKQARPRPFEAFRQEKFDAEALTPHGGPAGGPDHTKMAAAFHERMTSTLEKVLPILTPEQRKLAADKIRSQAASDEPGPFGH